MRILALADLHMQYSNSEIINVKKLVKQSNPDVILIAGDIFESNFKGNPYEELAKLERRVICCFGNHEFAYADPEFVRKRYEDLYEPNKYPVEYLDITGCAHANDIGFVGNVLWYDGSFRDIPTQSETRIDERWLDSSIYNFDFRKENAECIKQIKNNYWNGHKNILLTHTCPHKKLNLFADEGPGWPNMYSGCNLLEDFYNEGKCFFDWVICGHTHRYCTYQFHDQFCVNIGNDYTGELKYFCFEIE